MHSDRDDDITTAGADDTHEAWAAQVKRREAEAGLPAEAVDGAARPDRPRARGLTPPPPPPLASDQQQLVTHLVAILQRELDGDRMPPHEAIVVLAGKLNLSPAVASHADQEDTHPLRHALGLILAEVPKAIAAFRRQAALEPRQTTATARHETAQRLEGLLTAAQAVVADGMVQPLSGGSPPQARNSDPQREARRVFYAVRDALRAAGWSRIGAGAPTAPAIRVTCAIVDELGHRGYSAEALVKAIQRARRKDNHFRRLSVSN